MLLLEEFIEQDSNVFTRFHAAPEKVLFFDIETTGFSPDSSYVYLIGCAFLKENKVCLRQMLMEDASTEKELTASFLSFARTFEVLVHYNGATFDIPFLQKKSHRHHLTDTLCQLRSVDLYKLLQPLKKKLNLSDLKQKTVERYLGLCREDPFSGGDLIPVYTEFVARYRYESLTAATAAGAPDFSETGLPRLPQSPAEALRYVLLLHNKEDLIGLLSIADFSVLRGLLDGDFTWQCLTSPDLLSPVLDSPTEVAPCELCFLLQPAANSPILATLFAAPRTVEFTPDCRAVLSLADPKLCPTPDTICLQLTISLFHGTFKYFFEDYKEYYYLPEEDTAIHKSVAEFVDKNFRKKATRETCYQKKTGLFLPQPEEIFSPCFRENSKSALSFFTPDAAFLDSSNQKRWLLALLTKFFTP